MDKNLYNFFYPKTICIAGASSKPLSIGHELTNCILKYGFTGKLFLTNPKADNILGVKCYPDIKSINEEIDLAIILLPKNLVEEAIDDLIAKNVKSIVLITAGFKETGSEGAEREKSILRKIKGKNKAECYLCCRDSAAKQYSVSFSERCFRRRHSEFPP
jgi:acetyltransferase